MQSVISCRFLVLANGPSYSKQSTFTLILQQLLFKPWYKYLFLYLYPLTVTIDKSQLLHTLLL